MMLIMKDSLMDLGYKLTDTTTKGDIIVWIDKSYGIEIVENVIGGERVGVYVIPPDDIGLKILYIPVRDNGLHDVIDDAIKESVQYIRIINRR